MAASSDKCIATRLPLDFPPRFHDLRLARLSDSKASGVTGELWRRRAVTGVVYVITSEHDDLVTTARTYTHVLVDER
jgi:hypothetical protein